MAVSKQFTGAKTKEEFEEKDKRLARQKEAKAEGKTIEEIHTIEKKGIEDMATPKSLGEPIALNTPETAGEAPLEPSIFNLFPETAAAGNLRTGSLPIAPTAGLAAALRGGEATVNTLIKTVRSGKGGILGNFKTAADTTFNKLLTHNPPAGTTNTVKGVTSEVNQIANTFNWAKVANNAKNFTLKKTYLQKLAEVAKDPRVTLGILASTLYTSLFWAPNEKGDALTTLTIAQRDALSNGDTEAVLEINDLIQETLDISASIPVIGFIKAELAKFKAAAKASQTSADAAEKVAEEQIRLAEQGESDFAKERRETDEASFARQDEQAEKETERYDTIKEENNAEKLRVAQILQEVFRLRREGQFDEADELELTAYQ